MTERIFVPSDRHVERLAREGLSAETRSSLRARLAAALLPDVRFADAREVRLTLSAALGAVTGDEQETLLAPLRQRGGPSWVRAVSAFDEAIGVLRARGITSDLLGRVRASGVALVRARALSAAMHSLDTSLARTGAKDERLMGAELAAAIREASPEAILAVTGAAQLSTRWLLAWDPEEFAWWRALDDKLSRVGGYARIVLPFFEQRLQSARDRNPLELLADLAAKELDAAPELETITPVLGDLASVPPAQVDCARVRILRAADARSQARSVARLVREALEEGACVERIVIACPSYDEQTLLALRQALAVERIVVHEAFGVRPSSVPVVAAALHAMHAVESLERKAVARLLRSGVLDAPRLLAGATGKPLRFDEAERELARIARALESHATATGPDEVERLVRTATGHEGADDASIRQVFSVLARPRAATTRIEQVRAARRLFEELGLGARAGRGALGTFARDAAPRGVERAERTALARDVRAWEYFEAVLDAYEATTLRTGAGDAPLSADVFRLELTELLGRPAPLPSAGGAGAVRIMPLRDVAGEALDRLIVVDANEGTLPSERSPATLVTEELEACLARASGEERWLARAGELAARDLGALAVASAEASTVVFVTTNEQGADAATPARLVLDLEQAGVVVKDVARAELDAPVFEECKLHETNEVARRAERERLREGFFLDPKRSPSEVIGELSSSKSASLVASVVAGTTGSSEGRPLAVTLVERFAECAFKGFAEVVLGARSPEEQQDVPDAREEGNLAHVALAAAFEAARDLWPCRPRDREAILERGCAAVERVFDEASRHAPLRAIVRLRLREAVRVHLVRAIEDEAWDFAHAEQAFGGTGPWPAFEVSGASSSVWLRGSIDRIDRGHGRATLRVVDYKSGKEALRKATKYLEKSVLQVPLYAAVTSRRLSMPATGTYLPIMPRDLVSKPKAAEALEQRVSDLARGEPGAPCGIERRVIEVIESARKGMFLPLPVMDAGCSYCDVSGGCRRPRFAMPVEDGDDVDEVES